MRTIDRAAEAIDQQVDKIAYERGLSYAEALARIRDERPELLAGFFRVYRQDRSQRTGSRYLVENDEFCRYPYCQYSVGESGKSRRGP